MISLNELNTLSTNEAYAWFMTCCTAERWCELMTVNRPYKSIADIEVSANTHWQKMDDSDKRAAFKGHPLIGDISSLRAKYQHTQSLAEHEQAGAAQASEEVLQSLKQFNTDYLDKHGFIFIICATGLSASSMLAALKQRIHNDTPTEINNAAQEQLKITLLRIRKGIQQDSVSGEKNDH